MRTRISVQVHTKSLELDENLAYLLASLRDGCFIKNEKNHIYRIKVYQKNKEWIKALSRIIQTLFHKKPTISLDKRDNVWNLMVNSRHIYSELVRFSNYPGDQKSWNTPKAILNSAPHIQKEYMKGFFDSEGGVPHIERNSIEPKNIEASFTQSNKRCLEELKQMLGNFGIKTGKVCGPYYKRGHKFPIYRLKIHGIKEISKFNHSIGSMHPEKQRRLSIISNMDLAEA